MADAGFVGVSVGPHSPMHGCGARESRCLNAWFIGWVRSDDCMRMNRMKQARCKRTLRGRPGGNAIGTSSEFRVTAKHRTGHRASRLMQSAQPWGQFSLRMNAM